VSTGEATRHDGGVARLLRLADAAAARGNYSDALAWLRALEAMGHELDSIYESKREGWRLKVESSRGQCSQWFG
jgi:hypothetical protein